MPHWMLCEAQAVSRVRHTHTKTCFYLGVEVTDGDGRLSIRQSENTGELLCAGLWPLSSWLTPVNHSVQRCFHLRCLQAERGWREETWFITFVKAADHFQTDSVVNAGIRLTANTNKGPLLPVSVQQWERFPGRRLQWERETAEFTDRNSALHHIVCSWDSEGPETQQQRGLLGANEVRRLTDMMSKTWDKYRSVMDNCFKQNYLHESSHPAISSWGSK